MVPFSYRRPFVQLCQQLPWAQVDIVVGADQISQLREVKMGPVEHGHRLQGHRLIGFWTLELNDVGQLPELEKQVTRNVANREMLHLFVRNINQMNLKHIGSIRFFAFEPPFPGTLSDVWYVFV